MDEPDLDRVVFEFVVVNLALGGVVRGFWVQIVQVYVFGILVHSHLDGNRLRINLYFVRPNVPAIGLHLSKRSFKKFLLKSMCTEAT